MMQRHGGWVSEALRSAALGLAEPWSDGDLGRLACLGEAPDWLSGSVARVIHADQRYDTVLAILWLSRQELPADEALRRVGAVLEPEGRLLMIEPIRRPGWHGAAVSRAGSILGRVRGAQPAHSAPGLLRSHGFNVVSVERISMPRRHVLVPTLARIEAWPLAQQALVPSRPAPGVQQ